MTYGKIFLQDILKRPSFYFFVFLIIFSIDRHRRFEYVTNELSPIYSDVHEYYRILPDVFINHGQTYVFYKTTMGMAVMYSPAFFAGHAIAKFCGIEANGYTLPYRQCLRWLSIIYSILGLWLCRKSLLLFFNEITTLITITAILFGTNLFFYSFGWGEMPHSYLFLLNAIFINLCLRWMSNRDSRSLPLLALVGGLIILIRPTGAIILLFALFAGVSSWDQFKSRIAQVFYKPWFTVLSVFLFLLPFGIQLMYWKMQTGKYFYWSYRGERFFFNDPQIMNFLFSYRKGWLLYSPVMVFSLLGIVICWKRAKALFWTTLLITTVALFILSSWWEWSFGGSFGCRAMVEYYALLVFPLAAFVDWMWSKPLDFRFTSRVKKISLLVLFWFCIKLNLWQTGLFRAKLIHWSGMNKETYWYVLRKDTFTGEDYQYLYSRFTPPDHDKMRVGIRNN